jgi:hypothetical protein
MPGDKVGQAEEADVIGEGANLYRRRAAAEREIAATATLTNVRNRALVSAERWDELAQRAERIQTGAAERLNR